MARRRRHKTKGKKWHIAGKAAEVSKGRKHKPVALLMFYRDRMEHNIGRLENLIHKRESAGE